LVIEASGMIAIDYTGSQVLQQTISRLKSCSIDVAIARLSDEGAMVEAEQTVCSRSSDPDGSSNLLRKPFAKLVRVRKAEPLKHFRVDTSKA
jgi:hypothetical protein